MNGRRRWVGAGMGCVESKILLSKISMRLQTFEEGVFVVFRPAGNIAAFHVWTCLIWPLIAGYNSIFTDQISVDIDSPLLTPSFSSVLLFNTFLFLSVAWHRWTEPAHAAHSPGPAHSSVISPAWGLFSHIS